MELALVVQDRRGARVRGIEKLGWRRVDPRPWSKTNARWEHPSGWRLEHCGHPTANQPWALYDPEGRMHCRGGELEARNPAWGVAWRLLEEAASYVERVLSGELRPRFSTPHEIRWRSR